VLDVVFLIAPLLLAGILTLATIVLIELPLNFANIIALPLLLSLGVSYAIYFVSYARAGLKNPLQSSMARAVLFSAATALVAFGSLSVSSHPGTSSMGKLLTIALIYSLACSFFLLPALLSSAKFNKQ
jgi:predicted RND superfamily exporter protein